MSYIPQQDNSSNKHVLSFVKNLIYNHSDKDIRNRIFMSIYAQYSSSIFCVTLAAVSFLLLYSLPLPLPPAPSRRWHLGFCDWAYTPLERGFDTFYGYYGGFEFHFNHTVTSKNNSEAD